MKNKDQNAKGNAQKVQQLRQKGLPWKTIAENVLSGNKASLAQAITLIESTNPEHFSAANAVLEKCISLNLKTVRVGITGVPGVGKSTFIEILGQQLIKAGKKVAVLAVDPTSGKTKGSILGDKTRMNELARKANAFIRPSPSGASLGGVARKTREAIILCEAAGYDIILVETVGVGQSETAVHNMVDFFLLLKLSGAGDELQGIKRGIIEMADAIAINKADGANLKQARQDQSAFSQALHLFPPQANGWAPPVLLCSALENQGIQEIWDAITKFISEQQSSGYFEANRKKQQRDWFLASLEDQLKHHFFSNPHFMEKRNQLMQQVEEHKIAPFRAAQELLRNL